MKSFLYGIKNKHQNKVAIFDILLDDLIMSSKSQQRKYNLTKRAFYYPETNSKSCARCGEIKDVSLFFKHNETSDGWHSWCKDCCKEGNKRSIEKKYSSFDGRITTFLRSCKVSATKRKNEFSLTKSDLTEMWELQGGLCCYTGIEMTTQPALPNSVSVERIDNNVGYARENTVLVCNRINSMKSAMTGEEFFNFCKSVVSWLGDENGNLNVDFRKYE